MVPASSVGAMRITEVRVHAKILPKVGDYTMSSARIGDPDSTIVEVVTDTGLSGWGEVCMTGPLAQTHHAASVRADLTLAAPAVLGLDPRHLQVIWRAMNAAMHGGVAAKSALDIACWDLLGKATDLRVCDLLGGPLSDPVPTYHVVGIGTPDEAAAEAERLQAAGHTKLQLKAGGRRLTDDVAAAHAVAGAIRPGTDWFVDTNRGWTTDQAIRFSAACEGLDLAMEQPCATYAELEAIKPSLRHPLILDESAADLATIARAISTGLADGFGMKLTRIGGITAMRAVRDLCLATRTPTSFDDSWGGDIISAACNHVGSTMDPRYSRGAWTSAPYQEGHYDDVNGVRIVDGMVPIPSGGPGLGIEIPEGCFGEPIACYAS